jgi:protoheme IX farnesyltransferase
MLPAVAPARVTVRKMVTYTVLMVAGTLVLAPVAHLGAIYVITASVAGAGFLWSTVDLGRNPTPQRSMRVFGFSITYVTLLFAAMTIDVLVRFGV